MADLGSIGVRGNLTDIAWGGALRAINVGPQYMVRGGRNNTEGNPAAPSLEMVMPGSWSLLWRVETGSRTFSIDVKQAANTSPRPIVTIHANTEIGVNSDVTGTAGSSATWVTIGPLAAAPTSNGVLRVTFENRFGDEFQSQPCYWDNISVT